MKRLIVIAMLLTGACTRTPAPAGTSYIASDDTAAMLLELKPGEGHEVRGTLSAVGTGEGGKLTSGTRTFSGTIDGKAVNLSVENGTGVTLATGVMTGDGLELTFLNNGISAKMLFKPEPAEQFPKLVDRFRQRSAEQKQAAQQDALLAVQQKALSIVARWTAPSPATGEALGSFSMRRGVRRPPLHNSGPVWAARRRPSPQRERAAELGGRICSAEWRDGSRHRWTV